MHFERIKGETHVEIELTGLPPGRHGFHIHEAGDCSPPDASSAGEHFNPENKSHGMPGFGQYHLGDLGNLEVGADGAVKVDMHYKYLQLEGPNSIRGKSVVLHAAQDDLKTQPDGNAGARIACGEIN
jgi:Cu-Zn family superoxide dismutase